MGDILTTLDLLIFAVCLVAAMAIGLIAGRREETSADYFLAGRQIPWFGVAGSIFGSNVSANHMIGMMGIGFGVGFAQAHFELGAIAGLMLLCYGFLPVYRKLKVYTLSEYLGRRYDDRSRVSYAVIMILIMAIVQMVPGLYIGARSVCILLGGDAVERVAVEAGEGVAAKTTLNVNMVYYSSFVIALALIAASYTIVGGLKAVIWTDVIQSFMLLAAGIVLSVMAFTEIGGWGAMMAQDAAGARKMHLYLPSDHEKLPWSGVLTGLFVMHFFYWGTNQFIVQRALGARSDTEARLGIIAAGFLKLLIPFFAIGTGVAAFYLFQERLPDRVIDSDTAFTELVKLIIPVGYGFVGLIAAGVIGAILSSIDSMMNSAATILTVDVYKRYVNPGADDRRMILLGRLSIVLFMIVAALMAIFVIDPNSEADFFLTIVDYQSYLSPGLLVAFFLGIFWRRSTPAAGFVTIVAGIFFSWLVDFGYARSHEALGLTEVFGASLNMFHRVVAVVFLSVVLHVLVSRLTRRDAEKERLVWTDLGGHAPALLRKLAIAILVSVGIFAALGACMHAGTLSPTACAVLAAGWTLAMFGIGLARRRRADPVGTAPSVFKEDLFWAAILCAVAIFMMYYFY